MRTPGAPVQCGLRAGRGQRALFTTLRGISGTPTRRRYPQSSGDAYPSITDRTCRVSSASAVRCSVPRLRCCSPTRCGSISTSALSDRSRLCLKCKRAAASALKVDWCCGTCLTCRPGVALPEIGLLPSNSAAAQKSVRRGRAVYMEACTACTAEPPCSAGIGRGSGVCVLHAGGSCYTATPTASV
jgi:hypothetical protein